MSISKNTDEASEAVLRGKFSETDKRNSLGVGLRYCNIRVIFNRQTVVGRTTCQARISSDNYDVSMYIYSGFVIKCLCEEYSFVSLSFAPLTISNYFIIFDSACALKV